MDPKADKKLSIDLGSSCLVTDQWGIMTMCHADANYDIQTTDMGKRMFRSMFSLGDRLINVADHVKICDNKSVNYTVSLPLSLLHVSGDLDHEKYFSMINLSVENNLTLVTLRNSEEHHLSAYSLISYIIWYIFYKHTRQMNSLYTDMYEKMTSSEFQIKLQEKTPVISIPSSFSIQHVDLLQYAIREYHLPSCLFINQSIAFGMSFGYFRSLSLKSKEKEYFLVFNLGDLFFTISLLSISKESLCLETEYCFTDVGGREFSAAFRDYVVNTCGDERINNPLTLLQLSKSLQNAKQSICSLNVDTADIIVDGLFDDDEDFQFEANKADYFAYCEQLGLFNRFKKHCEEMLTYIHNHNIEVSNVIPLGGGMHFTYLREVVWNMFSSCCTSNEICLSINMEEDVAGGAIRISHLLVEGRLNFDTKMKDVGVYNYLPQDIFAKKRKHYFITCSDDYPLACQQNQWTCYQNITPQEFEMSKRKISEDIHFLLEKSKKDSEEAYRIHQNRMKAEDMCLQFYKACPYPDVQVLLNRVNKATTFASKESTDAFFVEIYNTMTKYNYSEPKVDLTSSVSNKDKEAIDDGDDDDDDENQNTMNQLRSSKSTPVNTNVTTNNPMELKGNFYFNRPSSTSSSVSTIPSASPIVPIINSPPRMSPYGVCQLNNNPLMPSLPVPPVPSIPPVPTSQAPPSIPQVPTSQAPPSIPQVPTSPVPSSTHIPQPVTRGQSNIILSSSPSLHPQAPTCQALPSIPQAPTSQAPPSIPQVPTSQATPSIPQVPTSPVPSSIPQVSPVPSSIPQVSPVPSSIPQVSPSNKPVTEARSSLPPPAPTSPVPPSSPPLSPPSSPRSKRIRFNPKKIQPTSPNLKPVNQTKKNQPYSPSPLSMHRVNSGEGKKPIPSPIPPIPLSLSRSQSSLHTTDSESIPPVPSSNLRTLSSSLPNPQPNEPQHNSLPGGSIFSNQRTIKKLIPTRVRNHVESREVSIEDINTIKRQALENSQGNPVLCRGSEIDKKNDVSDNKRDEMIVESEVSSEVQQIIQPVMKVEEKPVIKPTETTMDLDSIPLHVVDPSESVADSSPVITSINVDSLHSSSVTPQPYAPSQLPTATPQSIATPQLTAVPQSYADPQSFVDPLPYVDHQSSVTPRSYVDPQSFVPQYECAAPQSFVPQPVCAAPPQVQIPGNSNPAMPLDVSSSINHQLDIDYACEQAREEANDQQIRKQSSCCKKKKTLPKS